ncbi:hypothetical protein [Streptomyces sp. NPDC048636]|uniref:hypothetical protein n=1 Tax=Streptomyces sp. NPDC048636 TaxID=3155762 RepID=UPI00342E07EA
MSQPPPPPPYGGGSYPGAPPVHPGGSPGGGRGSRRRPPKSPMAKVTGAVVAVALLVGGGIWVTADKDSDGGGSTADVVEGKVLGKVPAPKIRGGGLVHTPGMWVTDRTFAKAGVKQIVGYPLDGGSTRWKIPLGGELCWSSRQVTKDGLTTVLFEDDSQDPSVCTQVGLVDLDKGKLLWTRHGKETGELASDGAVMFDEVSIGGGTVAAGGTSGGAAWTTDGKPLWMPESSADCAEKGYVGDEKKLIALRSCQASASDTEQLEIRTLNPRTRAVTSAYKLARGTEYAHVISTSPLVVGITKGGTGVAEVLTIDDSGKRGKLVSTVALKGGEYTYEEGCPATELGGCAQVAVDPQSKTLFLGTDYRARSTSGPSNEIVGIDLKTGKVAGKADGTEAGPLMPLGLDKDGSVIAYQKPTLSEGSAVWRIDPASYKKKQLMRNPSENAEVESYIDMDGHYLYAGKRLYLGKNTASKPSSEYNKKLGVPLAMVIGAE